MKKISLVSLIVVVLFLGYVAVKPGDYEISREITINAPAEKIFPYLNSSKLAEKWGPWMDEDPEAKMSYTGPDEGVGSRASWEGGKKLGTGNATIVESVPNQRVGVRLEYAQPMNMTQDAEYLIRAAGDAQIVTWKVRGQNSFMGRLM